MPAIMTLQDLLVHQLRDAYSAEKQLVAALPKMAKRATSAELKEAINAHLAETEEQVDRLEQVFEHLGLSTRGPKCKAMEGLIEEAKELLEEEIDPVVLDAGIIASSQRVEHYEIAVYGTVLEFARALGHDAVVQLLQTTLAEEKEANEKLTSLAEGGINALAVGEAPSSDDEELADENGDEMDDAPVTSRSSKAKNQSVASSSKPRAKPKTAAKRR